MLNIIKQSNSFDCKLDPATARPDNSIPMIAMKDTILRVYIDTQTDPTRPIISTISGRLEIRLPGISTWNDAQVLNQNIPPKQDSAINRANENDTLNFSIPGVLCIGNVDFRYVCLIRPIQINQDIPADSFKTH